MKLLYFSWIRERIGLAEEEVALPDKVATVGDLIGWLSKRGENYQNALANSAFVRVAVDQTHAEAQTSLSDAREVALFPPMTGG